MTTPLAAQPTGLAALNLTAVPGAPLLEITDLVTHFATPKGDVHAVDGVSLTVERGETLGVVGESGSGKTVLSRSAMGLLSGRKVIQKGSVKLSGHELRSLEPAQLRRLWGTEMAMVFQDPMTSLNPVMKIGRQIGESMRFHLGMSKGEAREASIAGLAAVGIPAPERRVDEYPHQLSGGMRQRVTIAIALACGPKLIFADEPTTALDVTVQAQILDLLSHQQQERNMGMVMVTHDLGVVAGRADRVAVMYAGQVVEIAKTADLFRRVRMPYTEALLRAIPNLSAPSHTRLNVIDGRPPELIDPPSGCRFAVRCPYAKEICWTQAPPLVESGVAGHEYRCWFPVNTPESVTVSNATKAPQESPAAAPEIPASQVQKEATPESGSSAQKPKVAPPPGAPTHDPSKEN